MRQSPKTQRSVRPLTHESQQKWQQRVAPGQRAIQIEQSYPGLGGVAAGGFIQESFTFEYIKIENLNRIKVTQRVEVWAPGLDAIAAHYDLFHAAGG